MSPERGRMALRCPRKVLGSQPPHSPRLELPAPNAAGLPQSAGTHSPQTPPTHTWTADSLLYAEPIRFPPPDVRRELIRLCWWLQPCRRQAGSKGGGVERSTCQADARAQRGSKVLRAGTRGPGWGLPGTPRVLPMRCPPWLELAQRVSVPFSSSAVGSTTAPECSGPHRQSL